MIYVTGDTHGRFERVERFCNKFETCREDVLIILGDAGINFSGPKYDRLKKKLLEDLPITIFAIHGNHEQRPQTIESYKEKVWNGGTVYYEDEFPHILFAKDGELFNFDGKKTVVIGGHIVLIRHIDWHTGMAGGKMSSLPKKSNGMWKVSCQQ